MIPDGAARRYAVEATLASGGFGHVLRARDRELDRLVAIKVLTSAALSAADQVQRFREEARITASLEHPNIVRVLDQGLEDGVPWIVYELVQGGTLRQELEAARRLPLARALDAATQVAAALDAAHARGVLHRDVKPENVLVFRPGHYKLTDFGIARWAGREGVHTATGVVLGTPVYLAPDLIRGEPPSAASDLYALGIMLFELLAGEPPFFDDSPLELLTRHLDAPPPVERLSGLAPAPVIALVAKLLAKHADQRPPSAAAVMRALRDAASGPAARSPGNQRSTRARPAAWVAGAALILGLSAVITRSPPPPPPPPTPSPADLRARLAAVQRASDRDEDWEPAARALCRAIREPADLAVLNDLAKLVETRSSPLTGRPPWTVELARARGALDGSKQVVVDAEAASGAARGNRNLKSQALAWDCMVEMHRRHGPGGAVLLTTPVLEFAMAEFDHRRTAFVSTVREQDGVGGIAWKYTQELESGPKTRKTELKYWSALALAALELPGDLAQRGGFARMTWSTFRSYAAHGHAEKLAPLLTVLPALRAVYPEDWLIALIDADVAEVRKNPPAFRKAMELAGGRLARAHLQAKLESSPDALEVWRHLINRYQAAAYSLEDPALIDDADREWARLVPGPGLPPAPPWLKETAEKLEKYRSELSRRRRK